MTQATETSHSGTAFPGDQDEFQQLTDPYRHELLVHCYRMLGSLDDAEDALQDSYLRAWRRLDSLKEQTSLRAWLYRIATNVSLDMLRSRKSRLMPVLTHPAADPNEPLPEPISDPIWLDPLPDTYLDGYIANPEARYEAHESITLAFLMALQALPGRQRAILILRDVLGWKAQEVADLLDLTLVAVNSALQRARATLKKYHDDTTYTPVDAQNEKLKNLLVHYVRAWEAADTDGLIRLLHKDAVLTMPPLPTWYRGQAAIRHFLETNILTGQLHFRLVPTRANGCPAFVVFQRDTSGIYQPTALQVLTLHGEQITQIDDFIAPGKRLFSHFGLPDM